MYRGSVHERLLDQQIKNYRAYAAKNAQTFGKEFKHLPNFDRHVCLEKLRKVIPASQNHENIPGYRFKAGLKAPGPTLNTFSIKPPRR